MLILLEVILDVLLIDGPEVFLFIVSFSESPLCKLLINNSLLFIHRPQSQLTTTSVKASLKMI